MSTRTLEPVQVSVVVDVSVDRAWEVFPDGIDRLRLKLAESRRVGPDGVQVQIYQRVE